MSKIATTRMSSRGQVVIPEEIRTDLRLEPGTQFVVVGDKDTVILKAINAPSMVEFRSLIREARSQASRAGMKRSDVARAVSRARSRSTR
jgi:AbrB family looped-hinge helix DNA binding protein